MHKNGISAKETKFSRKTTQNLRKRSEVLRQTGQVSYDVQVGKSVEHPHADQLRKRLVNMPNKSIKEEIQDDFVSEFNNQQSPRDRLAN